MASMHLLRTWLRGPTRWLVAAEITVVAAFLIAAWRVWDARQTPPAPASAVPAAPTASAAPTQRPAATPMPLPTAANASPSPGPTPGLINDPVFVDGLAQGANRVEDELEHAEWRALAALQEGARTYLLRKVVPDIEQAMDGK